MKSDVEITVTGLPGIDAKAVAGVSITYPYNEIPVASVQLVAPYVEENARALLCDPDSIKKQTRSSGVKITLRTKSGCIKFDGVFDGLSFTQSPGGMSYSAIIKSKFQVMREIYPKFIGVDPISVLPFKRVVGLEINSGNGADPYASFKAPLSRVDTSGKTLVEYYIELIKEILKCQRQLVTNTTAELASILKLMNDDRYKQSLDKAIEMLDAIDIEHAKASDVRAGRCASYLIEKVIYSQDTLWDTLISGLGDMGCMLLPANDKLFIIPQANYLKMTGISAPQFQEEATAPNHAYPVDYSNFSVNDVSFRNLRACYVLPIAQDANPVATSYRSQLLGTYPSEADANSSPDDGSTGILIIPAPTFIIQNIDSLYTNNSAIQDDLKDNTKAYAGEVVEDSDEPKNDVKAAIEKFEEQIAPLQEVLDKYAKSRFLQEKYSDRGGSFTAQLKTNWVPGTTGFVYSRHPGLFYCFFVNAVTHSISLGGGKVGQATTQVSFNSCRYGGSASSVPGTDEATLFNYTSGDMTTVQNDWLSNVRGS
jgi:hypothetical protein